VKACTTLAGGSRKVIIVLAVLLISAAAAYDIKETPPIYSDAATVIFFTTRHLADPAQEAGLNQSLIVTEVIVAQTTVRSVTSAGRRVRIAALPCNRSDLEYPDYAEQCATLTATATAPAAVRQAFLVAYRVLRSRLMALQVESGAAAHNRIRTYLVGMSGALPQEGSGSRVFAGLAVLTIIVTLTVSRFFEFHRVRFRIVRRRTLGRRRTRRHGTHGRTA
jgi:hypothetical protein